MNLKLGILCVLFWCALPAQAAFDIFLKLGDLKGESQDIRHPDEIEVLSWAWEVSNTGSATTGGAGAGKAIFQALELTKYADSASPLLMLATANGRHYPQAILTMRRVGGEARALYRITLDDVTVTKVATAGSVSDSRFMENVTLNFTKVKVEYFPQNPDGSIGNPVVFTWNLATNTQ